MELEIERLRVKNFRKRILIDGDEKPFLQMDERMIKKYFRPERLWLKNENNLFMLCPFLNLDTNYLVKKLNDMGIVKMRNHHSTSGTYPEPYYWTSIVVKYGINSRWDEIVYKYDYSFLKLKLDENEDYWGDLNVKKKIFEDYFIRCGFVKIDRFTMVRN